MPSYNELPSICLTEHHLSNEEMTLLSIDNYILGAYYSRKCYRKGGTCIFVCNSLKYAAVNLDEHCVDMDVKVCAIRLHSTVNSLSILPVYRSPTGNFANFLTNMELILHTLSKHRGNIIVCGRM
jgi:hypothetical protein